jgi:hypothetical protein
MPTPYINAVELDIVPAECAKFKDAILGNAAASVKEPGCRQFDVLFENSDPHHVFLYAPRKGGRSSYSLESCVSPQRTTRNVLGF